MSANFLIGKSATAARALLRKAFNAGLLEQRVVYHDFYDSCHPPQQTPDAPWQKCTPDLIGDLKKSSYGPSVIELVAGELYQLSTGSHVREVRVIGGAK